MITLSGDLGAGKTTFARALIRHLAGDPTVEVPSPTFTLMQAYELPRFPLVHADLYRFGDPAELVELGFDDLPADAVMLLEWPDRGRRAPAARPARHRASRWRPQLGPTYRDAAHHRLRHAFGRASSGIATVRRFLDEAGFGERRAASACRATPRPAPTSG